MDITAQVVYNDETGQVEVRIVRVDGQGDHVLATLPATPPPAADD